MTTLRPQPRFPEPDSQPFWEASKQHKLMYQKCNACQTIIFYPRRHCPSCGSLDTTWHESQGRGKVYTFGIVMKSRHPAFKDLGPYAVALVDLDEGFRMMTNIVGVIDVFKEVRCGMQVKVHWVDQGAGLVSLPMFEPE